MVSRDIPTQKRMETNLPYLNRTHLSLRDFTLLTDITQVLNECPTPLSLQDVLMKFKRIGLQVHPPAIEAIFDVVDSQSEGMVLPRSLAREYSFRVQQLSEEAFNLKEKAESTQGLIEALNEQIHSAVTGETMNSWGISEHSSLKVTVGKVSGLSPPRTCSVVVMCERQRQVTKPVLSTFPDGWDEEMEFRVVNGAGEVLLSLLSDNEILGQCAIPLPSLRDQKRHEAWVDLVVSVQTTQLKLFLALQWLHNLRQHLQDQAVEQTRKLESTMLAIRGADSLLQDLGMGGEEEWTETVLRKLQVSIERMKQTSCATQCRMM